MVKVVIRDFKQKCAFTLAEVLITLVVIGIVAVLTMPAMIKNHNQKAWDTAKSVFEKRIEIATRQMNTEEKLAGYSTTMDFVNELKKYIKITKICTSNEITKCFSSEVFWNQDEDPIDMSTIKLASDFGQDDWGTETVGVQFANGVNAIIAYNPKTTQDPYNNQFNATVNSMAMLYDVSGNKKPNSGGKDIHNINVKSLGNVTGCAIDPDLVGGMCITQILAPGSGYGPMSRAECEQAMAVGELGIQKCYSDPDYWAGAVKACGGIGKMPNESQLTSLSSYLYNIDASATSSAEVTLDLDRAAQFLAASPLASYQQIYMWAGQEKSSRYAYNWFFRPDMYVHWYYGILRTYPSAVAVCVDVP